MNFSELSKMASELPRDKVKVRRRDYAKEIASVMLHEKQHNFVKQSIKVTEKIKKSVSIWRHAEKQDVWPCACSSFFNEVYDQKDFEQFLCTLPGYNTFQLEQDHLDKIKERFDLIDFPEIDHICSKCWEETGDLLEYYAKSDYYATPRGADGYVYFLRNGFDWKIGATTQHDPWLRIRDHTKYYPELKLEHLIICKEPFEVEKWFHSYFDNLNRRVHGKYELFRFDEVSWETARHTFRESDRYRKSYDAKRLLWVYMYGTKKIICDRH